MISLDGPVEVEVNDEANSQSESNNGMAERHFGGVRALAAKTHNSMTSLKKLETTAPAGSKKAKLKSKMSGLLGKSSRGGDSSTSNENFSTTFADISEIQPEIVTKTFCKRTETTINREAQDEY